MNKKGLSELMWLIIAGVAFLVAIVVVLFIFGRTTGRVESTLSSCESNLGRCETKDACEKGGGIISTPLKCEEEDLVCCFGLKKQMT